MSFTIRRIGYVLGSTFGRHVFIDASMLFASLMLLVFRHPDIAIALLGYLVFDKYLSAAYRWSIYQIVFVNPHVSHHKLWVGHIDAFKLLLNDPITGDRLAGREMVLHAYVVDKEIIVASYDAIDSAYVQQSLYHASRWWVRSLKMCHAKPCSISLTEGKLVFTFG